MLSLVTVFLVLFQVLEDLDLHFGAVLLISGLLVLQALLSHLLVIHGVLCLVDGGGSTDLLHL